MATSPEMKSQPPSANGKRSCAIMKLRIRLARLHALARDPGDEIRQRLVGPPGQLFPRDLHRSIELVQLP